MSIHLRILFLCYFIELLGKASSAACPKTNSSLIFTDVQSIGFAVIPHDATFLNTRTAKVNCKAEGAPKPSISWETSDGKAVGNITGIRLVNYDGSLEFPAFEAKSFVAAVHRAQYRCVAKSSLGRLQSATIKINAGTIAY